MSTQAALKAVIVAHHDPDFEPWFTVQVIAVHGDGQELSPRWESSAVSSRKHANMILLGRQALIDANPTHGGASVTTKTYPAKLSDRRYVTWARRYAVDVTCPGCQFTRIVWLAGWSATVCGGCKAELSKPVRRRRGV